MSLRVVLKRNAEKMVYESVSIDHRTRWKFDRDGVVSLR